MNSYLDQQSSYSEPSNASYSDLSHAILHLQFDDADNSAGTDKANVAPDGSAAGA